MHDSSPPERSSPCVTWRGDPSAALLKGIAPCGYFGIHLPDIVGSPRPYTRIRRSDPTGDMRSPMRITHYRWAPRPARIVYAVGAHPRKAHPPPEMLDTRRILLENSPCLSTETKFAPRPRSSLFQVAQVAKLLPSCQPSCQVAKLLRPPDLTPSLAEGMG